MSSVLLKVILMCSSPDACMQSYLKCVKEFTRESVVSPKNVSVLCGSMLLDVLKVENKIEVRR